MPIELRRYTHLISQTNQTNTTSSQFNSTIYIQKIKQNISELNPFILLGICFAVVTIATIIIVLCCKKYHTRQLYQQSPQHFTSKPNLTFPQRWRFQQQIKSFTRPQGHSIVRKQTYEGKFIEVTFKTNHNCIYFPNQLTEDCYFQIQVVKLSSIVQIGFVHKDYLNQICKDIEGQYQINLDNYGVSVRTDGTTFVNGNNQINFPWKIQYGDTLGIGITQHTGNRRVWITKNGIIQNPPSEDQRIKYLDIDKQRGKETTTMKTKKKQKKQQQQDAEDLKKIKEKEIAAKNKIQIRGPSKFKYYAVIISQSPTQPLGDTILNWNVGGQNFRLHDAQQLVGILK